MANRIYDVITFTFQEPDLIPLGDDLYGDFDLIKNLIDSGQHGDIIAMGETQKGLSIYVRNTIGLNDNIFIPATKEWQRQDLVGQYSQFKTLVSNVLMSDI